eukprot:comp8405_c0_seq1/m.3762 comp8405_c0_seq1/g.3762  ORF comp8405_c0_seq1/g.3762 comp8405_c0_seq1/m.3762 type:complete len:174 (-) comp8405_c0_seq1:471-992(-)
MTESNSKVEELRRKLIRNINEVEYEHADAEGSDLYSSQNAWLSGTTAAKKLGASIDIVPAGKRNCPYHTHYAQEEMFIVLEGSGTLRVAGENVPIKSGDVIFIPAGPEYPHQILNTSDAPIKYISISTKEWPEYLEYPDSNKYMVVHKTQDGRRIERCDYIKENVDYWEGEPK